MQPTLNPADEPNAFGVNDFVLVEKWTTRAHWYRRGDVVLLRCEPGQKPILLLLPVHFTGSAASACGVGVTSRSKALERPGAPRTILKGMRGRRTVRAREASADCRAPLLDRRPQLRAPGKLVLPGCTYT